MYIHIKVFYDYVLLQIITQRGPGRRLFARCVRQARSSMSRSYDSRLYFARMWRFYNCLYL